MNEMLKTSGGLKWNIVQLLWIYLIITVSTSTGSSFEIPREIVHLCDQHRVNHKSGNNIVYEGNTETNKNEVTGHYDDKIEKDNQIRINKTLLDDTNTSDGNIAVLYLAGYDNEIFDLKNDLLEKGEGNELIIYLFLYKNFKYYNVGKIYTDFDYFNEIKLKYTHYFYVDSEMLRNNWPLNKHGLEDLDKSEPVEAVDENEIQYITLHPQKEIDGSYKFILPNEKDLKIKDIVVNLFKVKNHTLTRPDISITDSRYKNNNIGKDILEYPEVLQDGDNRSTTLLEQHNDNNIYIVDDDFLNPSVYNKYFNVNDEKYIEKPKDVKNNMLKSQFIISPQHKLYTKSRNILDENRKSILKDKNDVNKTNTNHIVENQPPSTPVVNLYDEGNKAPTNKIQPSKLISILSSDKLENIKKPTINNVSSKLKPDKHDNLKEYKIDNSDDNKKISFQINDDVKFHNNFPNILDPNIKPHNPPFSYIDATGYNLLIPSMSQDKEIGRFISNNKFLLPHYDQCQNPFSYKLSDKYSLLNSDNAFNQDNGNNAFYNIKELININANRNFLNYKPSSRFYTANQHSPYQKITPGAISQGVVKPQVYNIPFSDSKSLLPYSDGSDIKQNKYCGVNIPYKSNYIINPKSEAYERTSGALGTEIQYNTNIPTADMTKNINMPDVTSLDNSKLGKEIPMQWPQAYPSYYRENNRLQWPSILNAPSPKNSDQKFEILYSNKNTIMPKVWDVSLVGESREPSTNNPFLGNNWYNQYNPNSEFKQEKNKVSYYSKKNKILHAKTTLERPKSYNNKIFSPTAPRYLSGEHIDKNMNIYKEKFQSVFLNKNPSLNNTDNYVKIIQDPSRNYFPLTRNDFNTPTNYRPQTFAEVKMETPVKYNSDSSQPISTKLHRPIHDSIEKHNIINVTPNRNKNVRSYFTLNKKKSIEPHFLSKQEGIASLLTSNKLKKPGKYQNYLSVLPTLSSKELAQTESHNIISPYSEFQHLVARAVEPTKNEVNKIYKNITPVDVAVDKAKNVNLNINLTPDTEEAKYLLSVPTSKTSVLTQKSYKRLPWLKAYQCYTPKSPYTNEVLSKAKPSTKSFTPFKKDHESLSSPSLSKSISPTYVSSNFIPVSPQPSSNLKFPSSNVSPIQAICTQPSQLANILPKSNLITSQQYTNIPIASPYVTLTETKQNLNHPHKPSSKHNKLPSKLHFSPKPQANQPLTTNLAEVASPYQTIPNEPLVSEIIPKHFHTTPNKVNRAYQQHLKSNVPTLNLEPATTPFTPFSSPTSTYSYTNLKPQKHLAATRPTQYTNWPQNILSSPYVTLERKQHIHPPKQNLFQYHRKPYLSLNPQAMTVSSNPEVISSLQSPLPATSYKTASPEILPNNAHTLPCNLNESNIPSSFTLQPLKSLLTLNQDPTTSTNIYRFVNLKPHIKPYVPNLPQYRNWPQNILDYTPLKYNHFHKHTQNKLKLNPHTHDLTYKPNSQNSLISVPSSKPSSISSSITSSIALPVPSTLPSTSPYTLPLTVYSTLSPALPSALPSKLPPALPSTLSPTLPSILPSITPSILTSTSPSSLSSSLLTPIFPKPISKPSPLLAELPSTSSIPLSPWNPQNRIFFLPCYPKNNVKYICPAQTSELQHKYFPLLTAKPLLPLEITKPAYPPSQSALPLLKGHLQSANYMTKYYLSPKLASYKFHIPNKPNEPEKYYPNSNIEKALPLTTQPLLPSRSLSTLPLICPLQHVHLTFNLPLPSNNYPKNRTYTVPEENSAFYSPINSLYIKLSTSNKPNVHPIKEHLLSSTLLPSSESNLNTVPSALLPTPISKHWSSKNKELAPPLYLPVENPLKQFHLKTVTFPNQLSKFVDKNISSATIKLPEYRSVLSQQPLLTSPSSLPLMSISHSPYYKNKIYAPISISTKELAANNSIFLQQLMPYNNKMNMWPDSYSRYRAPLSTKFQSHQPTKSNTLPLNDEKSNLDRNNVIMTYKPFSKTFKHSKPVNTYSNGKILPNIIPTKTDLVSPKVQFPMNENFFYNPLRKINFKRIPPLSRYSSSLSPTETPSSKSNSVMDIKRTNYPLSSMSSPGHFKPELQLIKYPTQTYNPIETSAPLIQPVCGKSFPSQSNPKNSLYSTQSSMFPSKWLNSNLIYSPPTMSTSYHESNYEPLANLGTKSSSPYVNLPSRSTCSHIEPMHILKYTNKQNPTSQLENTSTFYNRQPSIQLTNPNLLKTSLMPSSSKVASERNFLKAPVITPNTRSSLTYTSPTKPSSLYQSIPIISPQYDTDDSVSIFHIKSSIPYFNTPNKITWPQIRPKSTIHPSRKYQNNKPLISEDQAILDTRTFKTPNQLVPFNPYLSYITSPIQTRTQGYHQNKYMETSTPSTSSPAHISIYTKPITLNVKNIKPQQNYPLPTSSSSAVKLYPSTYAPISIDKSTRDQRNMELKKVLPLSLYSKPTRTLQVPRNSDKFKNNYYLNYPQNKPITQNLIDSNIFQHTKYPPRESGKSYTTYLNPKQNSIGNTNINPFKITMNRAGNPKLPKAKIINANHKPNPIFNDIATNIEMNQPNIQEKTFPIPNIGILKCNPDEIDNGIEIQTDNPDILIKAWSSKIKLIRPRIVFDTVELSTYNFEPIVKETGKYNKDIVQDIVKTYVEMNYGEPIILKGAYNFYKPYIIYNVNNEYLKNGKLYIVWPTLCDCGCKWFGCQCHTKVK